MRKRDRVSEIVSGSVIKREREGEGERGERFDAFERGEFDFKRFSERWKLNQARPTFFSEKQRPVFFPEQVRNRESYSPLPLKFRLFRHLFWATGVAVPLCAVAVIVH